MKRFWLVLIAVLIAFPAFGQSSVRPCWYNASGVCTFVSAANPFPVQLQSGGGAQPTNITQVLGSAISVTNGLFDEITDGTNGPVAVKAASTAAVAADKSFVTQLNPLSPGIITLGQATKANSVPVVWASDMVGTAGSAATTVVSVQGIASMTPIQSSLNTTPTIANGSGVVNAPSTESQAALTPVVSAALESNHVIKASAGNLYSGYATTGATAGWLLLANATSAPTAGGAAIAPIACVVAPANATTAITSGVPIRASTGIVLVFSSSGCLTNTASSTVFFSGMAD